MTLPILDFPEDSKTWPTWLESQLVGVGLRELVNQLKVLIEDDGRSSETLTLPEILGDEFDEVVRSGLSVLSKNQIRQLLRNPDSLFELQDLVVCDGGHYWSELPRSPEIEEQLDNLFADVMTSLEPKVELASPGDGQSQVQPQSKSSGFGKWILLMGALAAMLLVAVFLLSERSWGLDRAVGEMGERKDAEYFQFMADTLTSDLSGDSLAKRMDSKAKLETTLRSFRSQCDRLILSVSDGSNQNLSSANQEWLREKCLLWRDKVDQHLVDLTGNVGAFDDVRLDAARTFSALIRAFAQRATAS